MFFHAHPVYSNESQVYSSTHPVEPPAPPPSLRAPHQLRPQRPLQALLAMHFHQHPNPEAVGQLPQSKRLRQLQQRRLRPATISNQTKKVRRSAEYAVIAGWLSLNLSLSLPISLYFSFTLKRI